MLNSKRRDEYGFGFGLNARNATRRGTIPEVRRGECPAGLG